MHPAERARQRLAGIEQNQKGVDSVRSQTSIQSVIPEYSDELLTQLIKQSRKRLDHAFQLIRRAEAAVALADSAIGKLLIATSGRGVAMIGYLRGPHDAQRSLEQLRLRFDPVEDRRATGA